MQIAAIFPSGFHGHVARYDVGVHVQKSCATNERYDQGLLRRDRVAPTDMEWFSVSRGMIYAKCSVNVKIERRQDQFC